MWQVVAHAYSLAVARMLPEQKAAWDAKLARPPTEESWGMSEQDEAAVRALDALGPGD